MHAHNHPRPSETTLGKTMFEYLLNFARGGSPNGEGLPFWQAHSTRRPGRHMELGASIGMIELPPAEIERHAFCSREFFGKRLKAELRRGEELGRVVRGRLQ